MFPDDLWIASPSQDLLYKYSNLTQQGAYTTEDNPSSVWVSQDKVTVYVANKGANTISIFRNGTRMNDIQVGNQPWCVCEDINGIVYCTNYLDNTVSRIENGKVTATIQVDQGPRGICVDGDNSLWVSCFLDNTVCKVVNDRNVKSIEVAQNPQGICCDVWDNIWVACYGSNVVSKITNSVKELDIVVGQGPVSVATDYNGVLCVCNYLGNNVAIVDTTSSKLNVTHIDISLGPDSVSVDSQNNFWVTAGNGSHIYQVSNNAVVGTINSCPNPTGYGDATGCQIYNILGRKATSASNKNYDAQIRSLQQQLQLLSNRVTELEKRVK